jgi:Zn-dependent protease with chaperone function
VKSGHVLLHDVVSAVLYAAEKIPLGDKLAPLSLLLWTREAEISADHVGLLLVQDESTCSRALIKLVLGLPEDAGSINIEEFLRQKTETEQDAVILQRLPALLAEAKANPPFVGTRVREMANFSRSSQFDELLRRNQKNTIEIELGQRSR